MNPADYAYRYGQPPQRAELPMDLEIIVSLIERIGLPAVIIGAAFWFIRYQSELGKKEREEMWAKDTSNDERLINLVESSTQVFGKVESALDRNTNTMKELLTEYRFAAKR